MFGKKIVSDFNRITIKEMLLAALRGNRQPMDKQNARGGGPAGAQSSA